MDAKGNFVIAAVLPKNIGLDGYGVHAKLYNSNGEKIKYIPLVNTNIANEKKNPYVSMNSNGEFVIVWTSYGQDGWEDGIFAQKFDKYGNKVDTEFQVNEFYYFTQRNPSVALADNGDFLITWES